MRLRHVSSIILLGGTLLGCQPNAAESSRGFSIPTGNPADGKQAFQDLKCTSCHEVEGLENEFPRPTADPQVRVKLGGLAMREPTDGELFTSIANPSHKLYPAGEQELIADESGESRMAGMGLNSVMSVQQLIDLVAFLHERYTTTDES